MFTRLRNAYETIVRQHCGNYPMKRQEGAISRVGQRVWLSIVKMASRVAGVVWTAVRSCLNCEVILLVAGPPWALTPVRCSTITTVECRRVSASPD